jgi:hypothetical protein
VPAGWTGSVDGCVAGAPSQQAQAATLSAINYFRRMEGLTEVTFDPALSAKAQYAALIMAAQNDLSHNPPSSWPCWTQTGHDAAGASNLALGTAAADAILLYMSDGGVSSAAHRRWVLYPPERTMGSGSTDRSNALYVSGEQDSSDTGPSFVAYPPAGDFPAQLEPEGMWSISIPGDVDFSQATVTVVSSGHSIPVTLTPVSDGYGNDTLMWSFKTGFQPGPTDRAYNVSVKNVSVDDTPTSYSYTTTLFDAAIDHRQTISFPQPHSLVDDQSQRLAATVASRLPVHYSSTTPEICTLSGSTVFSHGAGTCTVTADQPGDANFSPAATVTRSFSITEPPTTVSISGSGARSTTYGTRVSISGKATPGEKVGIWFHRAGDSGYTQRRTLTSSPAGAWSTSYEALDDYRLYATTRSARSHQILVKVKPVINGAGSRSVRKGTTYTIAGTGIPGAAVTVHFHKAGTAPDDFSLLRTVTVSGDGSWSRSYVAAVDYRFFATLPNGTRSTTILVKAS